MGVAMEVMITRHSVAKRPEDGLSPLQYRLLHEKKRIRIVDAPTGAGKSYAFQKALLEGQRILFIVPTRRLAQNLAAGLMHELVQQGEPWTEALARKKVAVFTSDQTRQLREQGERRISGYRLRQLDALDETCDEGEMIIAVPEVISNLLHRPREALTKGSAGDGVFSLLSQFDHIVFDEFHTIEAQGFGLAALFAKLASIELSDGTAFGKAKISFLSATPLEIYPTLEKLGVAKSAVARLEEELVDTADARPLHGDVCLTLMAEESLPACLQQHHELIQQEVAANRQVVVIYNALADLRRDLPRLKRQLQQWGISANKVLVINSIDDSGENRQTRYGFASGRQQNPDQFNILIATASVEMGVTFREANVMFMEPGFAPMSFLQRYGRAARRGKDGQVFVRLDEAISNRFPWQRELRQWLEALQGQSVNVLDFNRMLSASAQSRFETDAEPDTETRQDEATHTPHFGSLSHYANYSSGLYWQQLIQHSSNKGHRAGHLRTYQPPSSAHVYQLLKAIQPLLDDPDYQRSAREWYRWFMQRALMLRDIGKRVTVIEGDGFKLQADRVWLARETSVLRLPLLQDAQKNDYFQLEGDLDDYLLPEDERQRVQRMMKVYYPHKPVIDELKVDASLVREWLRVFEDRRRCIDTDEAWETYPEAMQAVDTLVRLTGCVAGHDVDIAADAVCGVLG
ncbi:DEAD/DEAH box helicase [Thiothrix nivea]|uniref:DEAD/DEAH box helicase domain protein n=1 Tax=Thiothrix nivea (strain ATCC 35100 / DSM 5205 / JP2) TaxID=870187 RepID=A0A656HA02_THINJ|nr:DEAD/DEAH box helicase [Thiothrix nivea]EIJ32872.1 DEAD/DEAH box helicase domain protein [Thiothrix nivea DSM 5205]